MTKPTPHEHALHWTMIYHYHSLPEEQRD